MFLYSCCKTIYSKYLYRKIFQEMCSFSCKSRKWYEATEKLLHMQTEQVAIMEIDMSINLHSHNSFCWASTFCIGARSLHVWFLWIIPIWNEWAVAVLFILCAGKLYKHQKTTHHFVSCKSQYRWVKKPNSLQGIYLDFKVTFWKQQL